MTDLDVQAMPQGTPRAAALAAEVAALPHRTTRPPDPAVLDNLAAAAAAHLKGLDHG